jgi:hypothetical protein
MSRRYDQRREEAESNRPRCSSEVDTSVPQIDVAVPDVVEIAGRWVAAAVNEMAAADARAPSLV